MDYTCHSDIVHIRFFCLKTKEYVRYWAPGNTGPKPSALPLPPETWRNKKVINNINLPRDSYQESNTNNDSDSESHHDSSSDNDSESDSDHETDY
jgi:hypothetical protein|tara:strand:+ start:117 stop:401 length:285 start_codon:yes stop_codon:yes gene_type:complete